MSGEHIKDLVDGLVRVGIGKMFMTVWFSIQRLRYEGIKIKKAKNGKNANSLNRDEMLVVSRLMEEANNITRELENTDRKAVRERNEAAQAA